MVHALKKGWMKFSDPEKDEEEDEEAEIPKYYDLWKDENEVCMIFISTKIFGTVPDQLTHYQMTNFRLFQTERVCRQQFQI